MINPFLLQKKNLKKVIKIFISVSSIFISSGVLPASQKIDIQDERVLNNPPEIVKKGDVLYFDGQITNEAYVLFLKEIGNSRIKTVSVNSIGGDVENALSIASYIKKNNMDIEVRSVCASACANYLFVAGNRKLINNDSYILWHGGANGPEQEVEISGDITRAEFFRLESVQQIKKKEALFYKEAGVRNEICYCPQLKNNYHDTFPEKWFSYSPEDMNRFGIKNISFATTHSQWLMSMRKKHVIFAHYCNQEK